MNRHALSRWRKIGGQPLSQVTRFTDIDHRTETIPVQVDTGLMRNIPQFLLKVWLCVAGHGEV
jgi:hypothetical protein